MEARTQRSPEEEAIYQRVREEIAKIIGEHYLKDNFYDDSVTDFDREEFRKKADQILAIPGIAILDDDQSLPAFARVDIHG